MTEDLIPVVLFLSIASVFIGLFYFRFLARKELQKTLRAAIEQGNSLTPELLEQLADNRTSPDGDLRRGLFSIAIALALVLFGFAIGDEDMSLGLVGVAGFPFLIGVVYLALWRFSRPAH